MSPEQRVCPRCRALQPPSAVLAPGTTIERPQSRIVIDAKIGEGGMGVVWRAWVFRAPGARGSEEQPPHPVALKVLRPGLDARASAWSQAAKEALRQEAEALRLLSHPNVVSYSDLFEYGGALVLAIEYVDGETLEAVVARHRARARLAGGRNLPCMPLLRAWYYFQQLLGALAASHALGIVHRDVKPSNLLIRRDGLVKLGDFGIAHVAGAAHGAGAASVPTASPLPDAAAGTGAYMSPEQVLSRPVDRRSDLYSAATVLYETLAGRTPFTCEKGEFLVRASQVEAVPPSIRTWLPQAPPVVDRLFARALAKDPSVRFDNAIEMGDAFREALGLPETAEWLAQAEFARTARTARTPSAHTPSNERKLATLREFVAQGYKTVKFASG
jgi:serine/threonine-protein kinase